MTTRIFSMHMRRALAVATIVTSSVVASAQDRPGYFTDPATGIVYRQVIRSVERPVVETKVEKQEQTVYRPEMVRETRPETKTVFTPVIEYQWQAQMHGRWNPFRQPAIAYKQVPQTRWEARNEVVNRTETRTQWVPERRTVEVPHRIVRIEREQKVEYEAVGEAVPQQANPNSPSAEIASRLQPLAANTQIQPLNRMASLPTTNAGAYPQGVPQIAASTVGRMTSDPPRRSTSQGGLRTTELYPTAPSVYGSALPPVNGTLGTATRPGFFLWR